MWAQDNWYQTEVEFADQGETRELMYFTKYADIKKKSVKMWKNEWRATEQPYN